MLFASILLFLLPIFLFPPFLRAIVPCGPLDIKTTRAIQVQQILFCFQVIAGFTTALSHGLARLAFRFRKQKHGTKRGAKINRMSTCFVLFMSFFFSFPINKGRRDRDVTRLVTLKRIFTLKKEKKNVWGGEGVGG